jgi:hypothetical protein
MPRTGSPSRPRDALPFRIELANPDDGEQRILARAASAQLARAIFRAAAAEHSDARVTLRQGRRIIADSRSEQAGARPLEVGK